MKSRKTACALLMAAACLALPARADVPEFQPPGIDTFLPAPAAKALFKALGITNNFRAYQGATPRGIQGFDLGLEASLVHLPSDFGNVLSGLGSGTEDSSSIAGGVLPSLKLQLYKGLGPAVDLGVSGFYLPGYTVWGISLKANLSDPEEGLAWAFRLSYSDMALDTSKVGIKAIPIPNPADGIKIGEGTIKIAARTVSPQLVASRKLDFAEPYIGIGADWVTGQVEIPIKLSIQSVTQTLVSPAQSATQFHAFTGVNFRIIPVGIRIAMEGSYGSAGMHTLGTVIGFTF